MMKGKRGGSKEWEGMEEEEEKGIYGGCCSDINQLFLSKMRSNSPVLQKQYRFFLISGVIPWPLLKGGRGRQWEGRGE